MTARYSAGKKQMTPHISSQRLFKGLRHSADPFLGVAFRAVLGSLGGLLGSLGAAREEPLTPIWGRLSGPLGCSRGLLVAVGEGLGKYLGSLGVIVGHLHLSRVALDALWGPLGVLWSPLGVLGKPLGAILRPSWSHLGCMFGPSGTHLGA